MIITIEKEDNVKVLTNQGEYGKMEPTDAVEYWKDKALKYREHGRKAGQALNEERDKNSALRGQLLRISKISVEQITNKEES